MHMKAMIVTASAMAVLFAAGAVSAHEIEDDDSPRVEKTYDFTGFDKIQVEGVYEVDIQVGETFSILTSGRPKQMNYSTVTKSGKTLILGTESHRSNKRWNKSNNGVRAVITLPALSEITLQGVGSVEATDIDAKRFNVELEGVGSIELSGTCGTLNASVEGIGSLEADNLECKNVDVSVEGMGSAEVYASGSVDAEIEGMGSIDVSGNPEDVQKSKSFMSSVNIR